MIFISAGHTPNGLKKDPGASGNGYTEAALAVEQRDLTTAELKLHGAKFITDNDDERLGDYLKRIETGSGSVVLEFHFDAFNGVASGCTCLVGDDADRLDKAFAKELVDITALILEIPNRGVKQEKDSDRGKLGLMRETGTVALLELCFIDNKSDVEKWQAKKAILAKEYAKLLVKYEAFV